jgi:hypothetical protein
MTFAAMRKGVVTMAELPVEPPQSAPLPLKELWPLVREYGISDDRLREEKLNASSVVALRGLVSRIDADVFKAINGYLDQTGDAEEAVPYGDLAQAAMEAKTLLEAVS